MPRSNDLGKSTSMTIQQIQERLQLNFQDAQVEVMDLTGTSDHIQVLIRSEKFQGKTRMQRHRMVMDVFSQELKSGEIHALTIQAETIN